MEAINVSCTFSKFVELKNLSVTSQKILPENFIGEINIMSYENVIC